MSRKDFGIDHLHTKDLADPKSRRGFLKVAHYPEPGRQGRWMGTIVWMEEIHKLWDMGEDEKIILDYLEANYTLEERGRRRPFQGIDWYVPE